MTRSRFQVQGKPYSLVKWKYDTISLSSSRQTLLPRKVKIWHDIVFKFKTNLAKARLNGSKKLVVSCSYLETNIITHMNLNTELFVFWQACGDDTTLFFTLNSLTSDRHMAIWQAKKIMAHLVKLTTAGTATSADIIPSSKAWQKWSIYKHQTISICLLRHGGCL